MSSDGCCRVTSGVNGVFIRRCLGLPHFLAFRCLTKSSDQFGQTVKKGVVQKEVGEEVKATSLKVSSGIDGQSSKQHWYTLDGSSSQISYAV